MIANTILAAGAFVSLVAAIPMAQPPFPKRDVVWETHTEVAMTTIPVTVTHWLEPGETPPTVQKQGGHKGHGHGHHGHHHSKSSEQAVPISSAAAPAPPASSPKSSAYVAPAPSSYVQPTSQAAPIPSTTSIAAPVPTTTSQAAAPPANSSPAAQPSESSGGSAPSGQTYTGELTYYSPSAGLSSCGQQYADTDMVVAIPAAIMGYSANPNLNPHCKKMITISYKGKTAQGMVVDTCPGCAGTENIDLSPALNEKIVGADWETLGRVSGATWWFNN